jgi:hypothetical protein
VKREEIEWEEYRAIGHPARHPREAIYKIERGLKVLSVLPTERRTTAIEAAETRMRAAIVELKVADTMLREEFPVKHTRVKR